MAYQPALLSAADWRRTIARLKDHFGTDAAVDGAAGKEIAAFLERHAGNAGKLGNAGDPPRTRGSHHPMNGQLRRHGVAFRSGDGYELLHPGDPNAPASETVNCRCRKTRRVLPVGQVAVNAGGGYDAKAAA